MEDKVSKLVAMIEAKLGEKLPGNRPALRLVRPPIAPESTLDGVTRESHLRMVRHLRKRWGLQVLVDQATFGVGTLEQLGDAELVQLHQDMHRAYEFGREGISLEEAGLIRPCGSECEKCWG